MSQKERSIRNEERVTKKQKKKCTVSQVLEKSVTVTEEEEKKERKVSRSRVRAEYDKSDRKNGGEEGTRERRMERKTVRKRCVCLCVCAQSRGYVMSPATQLNSRAGRWS